MAEEKILFDLDNMTLADLEKLEEAADAPVSAIIQSLAGGLLTARMIAAIVWISRQKTNPAFTLEDARAMKIGEVAFATPEREPEPNPPAAAAS